MMEFKTKAYPEESLPIFNRYVHVIAAVKMSGDCSYLTGQVCVNGEWLDCLLVVDTDELHVAFGREDA